MTQENQKKMSIRNLERIKEFKFTSYEKADAFRKMNAQEPGVTKVKIFARNDNTFDVVWYKKIEEITTTEVLAKETVEKHGKSLYKGFKKKKLKTA